MSRADSTSKGRLVGGQRPKPDIYTALLVIAFVALLVGCILLWLETRDFQGQIQGPVGTRLRGATDVPPVAQSAGGLAASVQAGAPGAGRVPAG